ncbi:hypothetical protein NOCA120009 [metagenome]|uniref:Uncharacterized protein n=1 Tax=metagenome TaxID=256318 RepID=A0A2P2CDE7_9ZZZZ
MTGGSWREHLAAIRPDADLADADWWDVEWGHGTPPAVGFLVPSGFEAYARVLHPAADADGRDVRWAEVAEACGTTLYSEAQWHRLSGGREYDPRGEGAEPRRWPGNEPELGRLNRPAFEALSEVVAGHTSTPSSDTDLDSTLVGGSRALVDELLADDRLEVLPWPVDGSLWSDADTVNA